MTAKSGRDARLDVARGLTMCIIFIAHVPANPWADWIPARFGFSSGAETFVLCSGLACGLAFGRVFSRDGFLAGCLRVGRRIAQLWVIQILGFAAFATLLLGLDHAVSGHVYAARYGLEPLLADPAAALLAVATLGWLPFYFDILPLYMVLLALLIPAVALARRSPKLVLLASLALWLAAQLVQWLAPDTFGGWYFNPLAWQFLFLIGYGATAGWVRLPTNAPGLTVLAGLVVLVSVPLTFSGAHAAWPELRHLFEAIYPADAITHLHPLRLLHVLALGWLFARLFAGGGLLKGGWAIPLVRIGQQSLPTFVTGLFLSAVAGVVLDGLGRSILPVALVNLAGVAVLFLVASIAGGRRTHDPAAAAAQKPPADLSLRRDSAPC